MKFFLPFPPIELELELDTLLDTLPGTLFFPDKLALALLAFSVTSAAGNSPE